MADETPNPLAWRESLRRIGESLQVLVRNRLELFSVEWQEEKRRLLRLILWAGIALAIGGAGVLIAIGLLAYWLWTTTGYIGVIVLAVVCIAIAALIAWKLWQKLHVEATPFSHVVAEFRKDGACLKKQD
jgi:uncharacterized membrane protein YqjE